MSPKYFILILLIATVKSAEEKRPDLYLYRIYKSGTKSVVTIEGDPLAIHCNVTYMEEELTPEILENTPMTFYKDGEILPDFWSETEQVKDDWNVEVRSRHYFVFKVTNKTFHRGTYGCSMEFNGTSGSVDFMARVKVKPSPLWPGVTFGAEVVLLFIILFTYEKTRNKHELEESDTENERGKDE